MIGPLCPSRSPVADGHPRGAARGEHQASGQRGCAFRAASRTATMMF